MLSLKDMGIVYETLLLSPGMNENIKLSLNLSRKNILLLAKVIERGLSKSDGDEQTLITLGGKETTDELSEIPTEILNKAGLQEMNGMLTKLMSK